MVSLKLRGPKRPGSSGGGNSSRSRTPAASTPLREQEDMDVDDSISVHRPPSPIRTALPSTSLKNNRADIQPKPNSTAAFGGSTGNVDSRGLAATAVSNIEPNSAPTASSGRKGKRKRTLADDNVEVTKPMRSLSFSSKGKLPVREAEQVNGDLNMIGTVSCNSHNFAAIFTKVLQDDFVDEYDFSNEPEEHESDYDDDGQDTETFKKYRSGPVDVITISSDDEVEEYWSPLNARPWNEMDEKARYTWEIMYCNVTHKAVGGDWNWTEDFQCEKDKQMLRCVCQRDVF